MPTIEKLDGKILFEGREYIIMFDDDTFPNGKYEVSGKAGIYSANSEPPMEMWFLSCGEVLLINNIQERKLGRTLEFHKYVEERIKYFPDSINPPDSKEEKDLSPSDLVTKK